MNACIAYENLADNAKVTASSAALLMPPATVQNEHVLRKWRGSNGSIDYLLFTFQSPTAIDTIALMGIVAETVRVRVSSTDVSGNAGDLYDSGINQVDQNYRSTVHLLPSVVTASYIRFDFTDLSGVIEAGRCYAGARHSFTYNFTKGWSRKWIDRSLRTKTRGGQTSISPDTVYRMIDVGFDFLTEEDRNGFVETIDMLNAQQNDVLFITDPSSANLARDSIWGLMTDISAVVQPYVNAFSKSYSIEERL